MSDKTNEKTVVLDTPILRGKSKIKEVVLRKPQSGALRGTRLQAIMDNGFTTSLELEVKIDDLEME